MAFAFVQQVKASETTGLGTYVTPAFGSSLTSGNTLIAIVTSDGSNAGQVTALTDTNGNVFVKDFEALTTRYVSVWRAPITVAGVGDIVTVAYNAASSNNSAVIVQEWSSASAFTLDQTKGNSATSATPTTGASPSTTVAAELVVAGFVWTGTTASTFTVGSGYSNSDSALVANANCAMESKVVASTGAQTAGCTLSVSRAYSALLVTYSEGAAPGANASNMFLLFI